MEGNIKITYEDIQKANKLINTTDIKGKEYAEVNQRIKAFRSVYPVGTIETEILSNTNGVCVIKATVKDEVGKILATGHAYEVEGSSFINKTSYLENSETSAIGRALGMCGFGIDTSVASADEVMNAQMNQDTSRSRGTNTAKASADTELIDLAKVNSVKAILKEKGISEKTILENYKLKKLEDMTTNQYINCIHRLRNTPKAGAGK